MEVTGCYLYTITNFIHPSRVVHKYNLHILRRIGEKIEVLANGCTKCVKAAELIQWVAVASPKSPKTRV